MYILCSQDASKDLEHFRQGTGAPFCVANTFTGRVFDIALCPVDVSCTAKSLAEAYRSRGVTVCSELEMDEAELGAIAILRRAEVKVGMQTYVLHSWLATDASKDYKQGYCNLRHGRRTNNKQGSKCKNR